MFQAPRFLDSARCGVRLVATHPLYPYRGQHFLNVTPHGGIAMLILLNDFESPLVGLKGNAEY